jgi:HD-GYP domain-containing protein (c-di-GMP phosphodiesterase class II)
MPQARERAGSPSGSVRLAEPVAALSLAADIGTGQPLEHGLRTCLVALELARRSGVADDQLTDVYYLALLRFLGCTADAARTAEQAGGNEIEFLASMAPAFMGTSGEQLRALVRGTGAGLPPLRRVRRIAGMLADVDGSTRAITAHCDAAQQLSLRLGVSARVTADLALAFERWDGKGIPGRCAGREVPAAVRVVVVARDVDLWVRLAGVPSARAVVDRRGGRAYDPTVAAAFTTDPVAVLDAVAAADTWQAVLDAEPAPAVRIDRDRLPVVLGAFADFADLKSPWLRGHSRGVAALAAAAARASGLTETEVEAVRHAGLVHDLGRVGAPGGVWDRPGPLSPADWDAVVLHPYLTERILNRSASLAPLARVAACHHERADGSGYYRGARAPELSLADQLLAAADAYQAMSEARPHRSGLGPHQAAAELRGESAAGRFSAAVVEAVLDAAGNRPPGHAPTWPAGLTDREVEVLRLIARGHPNRRVAADLFITPRTVGSHIEHIYLKIGVRTRAGAALFAMENGLL